MLLRTRLVKGLVGLCLFFVVQAQAHSFSKLIVFGDSLSDNGNLFALTDHIVPQSPYFNGRFTNGPVWPEALVSLLDLPSSALEDYAFGGAKTHGEPPPGLTNQVESYLTDHSHVDPTSLYTVWAGSNNYLLNAFPDESEAESAVSDVITAITQLADHGAQNFLVLNVPDLGIIPLARNEDARRQDTTYSTLLSHLSKMHNQKLAAELAALREAYASHGQEINFVQVDIFNLMNQVFNNPRKFSVSNVNEKCFSGDVFGDNGEVCANPNSHLFWDNEHPTAHFHKVIAQRVSDNLAEADFTPAHHFAKRFVAPSHATLRQLSQQLAN